MPISAPFPARSMWTVADLEPLPSDGNRYEILHGELLVTPMPSVEHQTVCGLLVVALGNWCVKAGNWRCLSPGGVYISETSWLEPDVAVYPVPRQARVDSWRHLPPPALVVEILSPSTRATDRHRKRPAYLAHGVGEVWLVDVDARTIERWTAKSEFPVAHTEPIAWTPAGGASALRIEAEQIFGPPG